MCYRKILLTAAGPLLMAAYMATLMVAANAQMTTAATAGPAETAPAPADNATVAGEIRVESSTHLCIGLEWPITGDANRNGKVEVRYRLAGAEEWKQAMPLHRIGDERTDRARGGWPVPHMHAGSILDLTPGQEYEIHLALTDPDGGGTERTIKAATRAEPAAFAGLRVLHVYPPDFAGKKQSPSFTGLKAAYAEATAGDVLLVHAGQYAVQPSDRVVVTEPIGGGDAGNTSGEANYVLDKNGTAERPIVIRAAGDGAAVFDAQQSATIFRVQGDYNRIEGLTLENQGGTGDRGPAMIHVPRDRPVTGLVVRRCTIRAVDGGIWANGNANRDFTISDNVVIGQLPAESWAPPTKEGGHWGHGIWVFGEGHAVCFNRVRSFFDGIDIGGDYVPSADPNRRACSIDFYNNIISECMDDCIELDYGVHNVRAFRNLLYNAHTAISEQPVHGGPAYIFRNVAFRTDDPALKTNNWPSGLLVYNNTFLRRLNSAAMWQNSTCMNNIVANVWTSDPAVSGKPQIHDYNAYSQNGPDEPHGIVGFGAEIFANAPPDLFEVADLKAYGDEAVAKIDLRLKEGCMLIDAGAELPNITDGFVGKAPDIGAYEMGVEVPHYGPRERSAQQP